MIRTAKAISTMLLALGSVGLQADVKESGWMELVKGSLDDVYGAEVHEVGTHEGRQKLTIAIPKASIDHPNEIEEVLVVGQKPAEPEPLLDIEYHWVEDYHNDYYGLIIYLDEKMNVPIRLYMHSDEGFIR